jgi:hypothetical protein
LASHERRREFTDSYEQTTRRAGVYGIRNRDNGRMLLATSRDLDSMRNRFDFGVVTGSVSALDGRLAADARVHGIAVFEFVELDELPTEPDASSKQVDDDLSQLEELWRAKLDDAPLY